jgi:hypothetical protein
VIDLKSRQSQYVGNQAAGRRPEVIVTEVKFDQAGQVWRTEQLCDVLAAQFVVPQAQDGEMFQGRAERELAHAAHRAV